MANLYVLPDSLLLGLSLLVLLSFTAEVILFYYLRPLSSFRRARRKALEICALLLFLYIFMLIERAMGGHSFGIFPLHPYAGMRLAAALAASVLSIHWAGREKESLFILLAALSMLPFFDEFLPWNLLIALALLDIRTALLFRKAYRKYHKDLTDHAIEEAINKMEDGVFLTEENGNPVLMNRAMEEMMKISLGEIKRNGQVFWQEITERGKPFTSQGNKILCHGKDGRIIQFSRRPFQTANGFGWQIDGSDITELYRMNRELEKKNDILRQKNRNMKELLEIMVRLESREALRDIRFKIHDMMGQRISYLQQILNNKDYKNYGRIGDILSHLLTDMKKEITVKPALILSELIDAYSSLGIHLTVEGKLPSGSGGSLLVEIIREAASNAVIHGKAGALHISFSENGTCHMTISDNGLGSKGPVHEGGGLSSIRSRVEKRGGTFTVKHGKPFTLIVDLPRDSG